MYVIETEHGHRAHISDHDNLRDALVEAAQVGADLSFAKAQRENLSCLDLGGAKLEHALMQGVFATRINLKEARLQHAHLEGADLSDSNFDGAQMFAAQAVRVDARNSLLRGVKADHAFFGRSMMSFSQFNGSKMVNAYFSGCQLHMASFRGCKLAGAVFDGADLTDADLRGADLRNASFKGACLNGADLSGAKLGGASFKGVCLKTTKLHRAWLSWFDHATIGHILRCAAADGGLYRKDSEFIERLKVAGMIEHKTDWCWNSFIDWGRKHDPVRLEWALRAIKRARVKCDNEFPSTVHEELQRIHADRIKAERGQRRALAAAAEATGMDRAI